MNEPATESKDFLMKKIGPLPLAAYLVAGAALVGFYLIKKRGSANNSGSNIAQAPTGIVDPTTDQNAGLIDQLNSLEALLAGQQASGSVGNTSTGTATATDSGVSFQQWASSGRPDLQQRPGVPQLQWLANLYGQYIKERGWWTAFQQWSSSGRPDLARSAVPGRSDLQYQHDLEGEFLKEQGQSLQGYGAGDEPRILPSNFQQTPKNLGTEMRRVDNHAR